MFDEVLKRGTRVQTINLVGHKNWNFGEMELQYNLKALNVTELITEMQITI